MTLQTLKTKLYIPVPRAELVTRNRLLDYLENNSHRKLVLVSAPAGFGKTTLLSEWIASRDLGIHTGWLSLDPGDNDAVIFWTYVILAVQKVLPGFGDEILNALTSPQPPPVEALVNDLINEAAGTTASFALVLDDFHVITNTEITHGVNRLLKHLPQGVTLIVSSRADPPWALAQMRAHDQITELRAEDLRFTPQEVHSFLNESMNLDLSPKDIHALDARTEGWIAGLQLAAISMRGREPQAFINAFSGSHRYVLDYLVEEVLGRQPADVRKFLLNTSILERLCAPLCDAVADISDSRRILDYLERRNLFLTPLDDERHWYRYHHLFSELLRNQLAIFHSDQLAAMHRRASAWHEKQGYSEESINHALAAEDYQRVARLVEKYARGMMHQSKYNTVFNWIEALPEKLVLESPWLCVYQSWTRHWAGQREGGEEILVHAEEVILAENRGTGKGVELYDEDTRGLLGSIATVRAHYAVTDENLPRAREQAERAMQILPQEDYFTRGTAAVALGAANWGTGDVNGAEEAFSASAANAMKGGYNYRASSALVYMGMQQVKQGRLKKAQETYEKAVELALGPGGRRFPNAGYPLSKMGELACEWNDLEAAKEYTVEGLELCTQLGHVDLLAEANTSLARVQLAMGDLSGLRETIDRTERLIRESKLDPWVTTWLDEVRVRLWLSTGRMREALHWVETSGLKVEDPFNYHHELEHINLARVLVFAGTARADDNSLQSGLVLLDRLLGASETAGWVHESIKILIQKTLALKGSGKTDSALNAFKQALKLAEPGGYVRLFLDEGAVILDMLRLAARRGISMNYVGSLLSAPQAVAVAQGTARLIEPLSARELEVLRLLASHLSVPEIADELVISVHTVRSHVKNLYMKLEVHSRMAAVQRAKELHLI